MWFHCMLSYFISVMILSLSPLSLFSLSLLSLSLFFFLSLLSLPSRTAFHQHAKNIEGAVAKNPALLAPLKLHYLRWLLFPINGETYFMYQGIFDTEFDKYTDDAVGLFGASGVNTVFENLEGFPSDWATNPEGFVKYVREHQVPSFLEYGEYPFVSADEIKKALQMKSAFTEMLDQLQ